MREERNTERGEGGAREIGWGESGKKRKGVRKERMNKRLKSRDMIAAVQNASDAQLHPLLAPLPPEP